MSPADILLSVCGYLEHYRTLGRAAYYVLYTTMLLSSVTGAHNVTCKSACCSGHLGQVRVRAVGRSEHQSLRSSRYGFGIGCERCEEAWCKKLYGHFEREWNIQHASMQTCRVTNIIHAYYFVCDIFLHNRALNGMCVLFTCSVYHPYVQLE